MQGVRISEGQMQQELQWIQAAKKDPRYFSRLYEKYYRQIFLFVFKRTGEEDICADIVSQVFLKAMVNLPRYTYRGVPFSAWLYRIASNEVNQHYRSQKSDRTISLERSQLDKVLGGFADAGEVVGKGGDEYEEQLKLLLETMTEMKPEEVELIELRFFEQRPFKEVAFILGITENNAKVKAYRILERLKKRVKKNMEGRYEA